MQKTELLLHTVRFSILEKWSALPPVQKRINSSFPLVPLSKILKRAKETVNIEDGKHYKRITVRLYGKGVVPRDIRPGSEIGTKHQFIAHAGQLILSRIDARNGAFGIVTDELDGAIVTNDFWLFEVKKALPQYLMLILSSDYFQKYWQLKSSGTTNRQRIDENDFLSSLIALPPIEKQSLLIKKYNETMADAVLFDIKAQEEENKTTAFLFDSLGIKECNMPTSDSLISVIHFANLYQWGYDKASLHFPYVFEQYNAFSFANKPLWVKSIFRGRSPKYSLGSSKIILNQKCNRMGFIDLSFAKEVDNSWLDKIDRQCLTREGDIIINSTGEGTIGRASLVKTGFEGLAYDSHLLLLRVNKKEVDARLIVDLINSPFGQKQVDLFKSAQATKQTELGIDNLRRILFPLPPLSEQKRIASYLEERKHEIKTLRQEAESLRKGAKKTFEGAVLGEA